MKEVSNKIWFRNFLWGQKRREYQSVFIFKNSLLVFFIFSPRFLSNLFISDFRQRKYSAKSNHLGQSMNSMRSKNRVSSTVAARLRGLWTVAPWTDGHPRLVASKLKTQDWKLQTNILYYFHYLYINDT